MLALLERGPRSWPELAAAGLTARAVRDATAELGAVGVAVLVGLDVVALLPREVPA